MRSAALALALLAADSSLAAEDAVECTIDLALPGTARVETVPASKSCVLVLVNTARGADYQLTYEERFGAKRTVPLLKPGPRTGFPRYQPPEGCTDLKAEGVALLATVDEADVVRRIMALQEKLAAGPCSTPDIKSQLSEPIHMTRVSPDEARLLTPGEVWKVLVERLSADKGTVVRSWSATFRGAAPSVGWEFPDEQTWIVHEVGQSIVEMAEFAGSRKRLTERVSVVARGAGPDLASYRVRTATHETTVVLKPHAWAPQAYAPLARAHLPRGRLAPAARRAGAAPAPVAARLTDLRASVIETESLQLSARLTAEPLDVQAQEEAALVLGALALREAAGAFSDIRPLLSRLTAHLAIASVLRGRSRPSEAGRLAEIILTALVGRQVAALELLSKYEAESAGSASDKAWVRALSLRIDGDWRRLEEPSRATLLERIEYFRALSAAHSVARSLVTLPASSLEPIPDWSRLALSTKLSVEEGHAFALAAIPAETDELRKVWQLSRSLELPALSASLDEADGHTVEFTPDGAVAVVGWRTWALIGARHISNAAVLADDFLQRMLGLSAEADALVANASRVVGSLPLYEFAQMRIAEQRSELGERRQGASRFMALRLANEQSVRFCAAADTLIRKAPETLTVGNWDRAYARCGRVPPRVAAYSSWFAPIVPAGTAFDLGQRLNASQLHAEETNFETLRRLAPFDAELLVFHLMLKYREQDQLQAIVAEFQPLAPYKLGSLRDVATVYSEDATAFRNLLERLCAFSADRCPDLGDHLVSIGATSAAVTAYQRAFDSALHRVALSRHADWLVNYYEDQGDHDKAAAIASMAAETYSEAGLLSMARYQERVGNHDSALASYEAIAERYGHREELLEFYVRYRTKVGDGRFVEQADAAIKTIFPNGLLKLTASDLERSLEGIKIRAAGELGQRGGLHAGDIVVGLDGYRVTSTAQYGAIKAIHRDPEIRLTVWHQNRYVEVVGKRSHVLYFNRVPERTYVPSR